MVSFTTEAGSDERPYLERPRHLGLLRQLLGQFPAVALIGARQVGKTTLARALASGWNEPVTFFDLEDPTDQARLAEPKLALEGLRGLVVIDEVQQMPELFPLLRVLIDRPARNARFLLLGSASPTLLRSSAETLAGRIAYHHLPGFDLSETGAENWPELWTRGGFPPAYLAATERASLRWREAFIRTHLERDLPMLGLRLAAPVLRRFWSMLAHWHGQLWNGAELARGLGVSGRTVRHYLDVLTATFMVRVLQPWHENLGKRMVKSPKVYLADSGLLHALLRIEDHQQLLGHPKVGASWEGFALEQLLNRLELDWDRCHFWKLHSGAELDLLVEYRGRRLGFEFKFTARPATSRSMHAAMEALRLDGLFLVYPGKDAFPLAERIEAVPLEGLWRADFTA